MSKSRKPNRVLVDARAPRSAPIAASLARLAKRYLRALGLSGCELSLSVVTDAQIRVVNREWRHKDKPTDVLSFPAGEQPLPPGTLKPLGDVMISLETARSRASEEGRPLQAELARYLAHGLLHVLGHDHHQKADAARMMAAERKLLGSVGMVEAALGPVVDGARSRRAKSRVQKGRRA